MFYPADAMVWIKNHGQQYRYNIEWCNFIAQQLEPRMKACGKSFSARWGPMAENREMPNWTNTDFNLMMPMQSKETDPSYLFQYPGGCPDHHCTPFCLTPYSMWHQYCSTTKIQQLIQTGCSDDGSRLFTISSTPDTVLWHALRTPQTNRRPNSHLSHSHSFSAPSN